MVTSDLRAEVASISDKLKWWPLRLHLDVQRRRLYVADNEWKDGKWTSGRVVVFSAILCMHSAFGRYYRNSSFILDLAMVQIPRYTDRISS